MDPSVDPIDAHVRKDEEPNHGKDRVTDPGNIGRDRVVKLRITTNLKQ